MRDIFTKSELTQKGQGAAECVHDHIPRPLFFCGPFRYLEKGHHISQYYQHVAQLAPLDNLFFIKSVQGGTLLPCRSPFIGEDAGQIHSKAIIRRRRRQLICVWE